VVVGTKGGITRGEGETWGRDGSLAYLRSAVEKSLRNLGVEQIDLYQWHRPDRWQAYGEVIGHFKTLQDEGKIKHVGISNVSVDELSQARGIVEVVSVQNEYNLEDRDSEDVLDACEEANIGFIPWFPLATGRLAEPGGPLDRVAGDHDATPGQIALAWLLARSPVMLPIPGTSSIEHLEENLAAARIELSQDEVVEIGSASGG